MKNYIMDVFKELITIDTSSDPESKDFPSTEIQSIFGELLCSRLCTMGVDNVTIDKYGYVYASLPANCNNMPAIGFIAHMDTSPDFCGKDIKPNIIEDYNGEKINLKGISLDPKEFKHLKNYVGKTLITTDGTTLLGADDKAGIAEILAALKYFIDNPRIKHGKIGVCFTPDEEIGRGADYFDVKKMGCDFAYTMDGGILGELSYENFNAARAKIDITGKSVHPGEAKDIMINASLLAMEFNSMLPQKDIPAKTCGYEGFFHLTKLGGSVESAHLDYIIRDFNKESFLKRKALIGEAAEKLNSKYGCEAVKAEVYDEYLNMYEVIGDNSPVVARAVEAMKKAGIEPLIEPIRGGTDGARISFMGLPCPNIFTGGHNYHGPYEYICAESMVKATETIINIVTQP